MSVLPPLAIAAPLLGATALVFGNLLKRRRLIDIAALAIAAAVLVITILQFVASLDAPLVHWFGGWLPEDGRAVGIAFAVEPLGASLALLAALLTTASLVFSWHYFDAVGGLYHVLIMVFLAAMIGFALSGDLFNLFVFFELMSVSAIALTGYKTEESEPLQGALNFGVLNGIAAFLILVAIGLLYARTGALNLAQLGESLATRPPDGLVIVAFSLLVVGFFVKSAMVPFHFWLADAYAVAPVPVCVLFAGIMSELGVYAVALIYWTVFEGPLGPESAAIRAVIVGVGAVTAVVAAIMCLAQRRLKRLMAFATMSHAGLFLVGVGLLTPNGLAGTIVYVFADALVKTALFFTFGVLLHRYGSGDELRLHGRGRDMRLLGALVVLGGLGLAGLPPFGTYLGKAMIEEAASTLGYSWMTFVFLVSAVFTAAAVLRVAGRVFMGWGPAEEEGGSPDRGDEADEESETSGSGTTPAVMVLPALLFALLALGSGLLPDLSLYAERAAETFQDRAAYASAVLEGVPAVSPGIEAPGEEPPVRPPVEPAAPADPRPKGALLGLVSAALAVALALGALFPHRLPAPLRAAGRGAGRGVALLRGLHSGHVGDYVAWLTLGAALVGGIFTLTLG